MRFATIAKQSKKRTRKTEETGEKTKKCRSIDGSAWATRTLGRGLQHWTHAELKGTIGGCPVMQSATTRETIMVYVNETQRCILKGPYNLGNLKHRGRLAACETRAKFLKEAGIPTPPICFVEIGK